ncbi:MAG: hypothetical protein IJH65_03770 [Methanobrevibacter sp.]|nr:hypothetical protein [Methanobrevibacter sp.]
MRTETKKNINFLKEDDLYNLILYAIFKFTGDPKYSTASELIYTLDKDNLLNLCSTFGGCTIKIPTILELKTFINALLIYYTTVSEHKTFNEVFNKLELDTSLKKDILNIYKTVVEVMDEYTK